MNVYDQKKQIATDPDYIALKLYDFSMAKLLERYPEGAPDKVIAKALLVTEPEVEELYQSAVSKLRMIMGVASA